jgi:hypothetical protein
VQNKSSTAYWLRVSPEPISRAVNVKKSFSAGASPRPHWGSSQRSPRPLAELGEGREGIGVGRGEKRERRGKGRERKGKGEKGMGEGKGREWRWCEGRGKGREEMGWWKGRDGKGNLRRRDEINGDGGKRREESRGTVIVCHAINTEKLGKSAEIDLRVSRYKSTEVDSTAPSRVESNLLTSTTGFRDLSRICIKST